MIRRVPVPGPESRKRLAEPAEKVSAAAELVREGTEDSPDLDHVAAIGRALQNLAYQLRVSARPGGRNGGELTVVRIGDFVGLFVGGPEDENKEPRGPAPAGETE